MEEPKDKLPHFVHTTVLESKEQLRDFLRSLHGTPSKQEETLKELT